MARSEKRRHPRRAAAARVTLQWHDAPGRYLRESGKWHDVSDHGGGVSIKSGVPPGSVVRIDSPGMDVAAMARVRYCSREAAGCRIGLEFVSGTWRPPKPPEKE